MRVLVIRPEVQAQRTAAKLAQLGHEAVIFPLFQPLHDTALCREALKSSYSALAITSAESVRCMLDLGDELKPYLDRPLFTVGRATARCAREAGFTRVIAAHGNGHDFAALVAGHIATSAEGPKPVLYLAGVKRNGGFEETLRGNDIDFATAEIYDMAPVPYTIEQQQAHLVNTPVDAVFFFSKENAKAFFALDVYRQSRESLARTLFFCLSRNIAEAVPEELRHSAVISDDPDEDELMDLL